MLIQENIWSFKIPEDNLYKHNAHNTSLLDGKACPRSTNLPTLDYEGEDVRIMKKNQENLEEMAS